MLDDRKSAILRAVVKEYIETAQPVGSAHAAHAARLGVSSATVRNEMAALEREGFLVQPHTSAGRIPTDKGYRFFVDHLTPPLGKLAPGQKHQVREFFARAHGELEQMLHDTTRLLSGLTACTALVLPPSHEDATVRSVQLVSLGPRVAMVVAVLANTVVEKAIVELEADTGPERVAAAGAHLAAHLSGRALDDREPVPATGDPPTDQLVVAAREALWREHQNEAEQVFVGGAASMAATFDAVESVRQVLAILEQQYVVVTLLRQALAQDRLGVAIGAEHGVESLAECSIVVAPFGEGGRAGSVGVLGPTRMNYPQAMAAVAVVSQGLARRLSEG